MRARTGERERAERERERVTEIARTSLNSAALEITLSNGGRGKRENKRNPV